MNILPNRVADIYIKLKSITSKLQNTSASIPFIIICWCDKICVKIPKFSKKNTTTPKMIVSSNWADKVFTIMYEMKLLSDGIWLLI